MVARAYRDLLHNIDAEIIESFKSAKITKDGIDLDAEGLRGPASTWTYLISDNPFGDWLQRFFKGVRSKLSGESTGTPA